MSFVVCFCSLFWPWPCTKHNSCLLRTEDLTNRNVLVMICNLCILYERKTKDYAQSWTFQPKGLDKRQTFYRLDTLFGAVWPCLIVLNRVWSCLIKFEGHQTFDQKLKLFLLFSCLMGDVLFVWTAAYQTCLMGACVPCLLSGLYQLFDLCLIKHVLIVWTLTSTLACLVAKHFLFLQPLNLGIFVCSFDVCRAS